MSFETNIRRTIAAREGVGITASIMQRNDLFVGRFATDHATFIFIRRGKKILKAAGKKIVLFPGDAVALAAGTTCDVQNEMDRGQFEANWIVCPAGIVARAAHEYPKARKLKDITPLKNLGSEFSQAFERGITAIAGQGMIPQPVAESRMQELLAWLAHTGFIFNPEAPDALQRRVRLMIGAAPDANWLSRDVAQSLAMSEATFRRRLAGEGQSFGALLIDVRMATALTLLQATDTTISEIAWQVGYESVSRFSVRFKKRFGFSPTAVRGVPVQLEG